MEGAWRWSDCSNTDMYSNWVPGAPVNDGMPNQLDCAYIMNGTAQWNDELCDRRFGYVCEVSPKRKCFVHF